jgi:hypothetical protein
MEISDGEAAAADAVVPPGGVAAAAAAAASSSQEDGEIKSDVHMVDPGEIGRTIRKNESSSLLPSSGEEGESGEHQKPGREETHPTFPKLSSAASGGRIGGGGGKVEYRRVRCPPHRYTPLREHWEQILTPLVEHLKLQVRAFAPLSRRGERHPAPCSSHRVVRVEKGNRGRRHPGKMEVRMIEEVCSREPRVVPDSCKPISSGSRGGSVLSTSRPLIVAPLSDALFSGAPPSSDAFDPSSVRRARSARAVVLPRSRRR